MSYFMVRTSDARDLKNPKTGDLILRLAPETEIWYRDSRTSLVLPRIFPRLVVQLNWTTILRLLPTTTEHWPTFARAAVRKTAIWPKRTFRWPIT